MIITRQYLSSQSFTRPDASIEWIYDFENEQFDCNIDLDKLSIIVRTYKLFINNQFELNILLDGYLNLIIPELETIIIINKEYYNLDILIKLYKENCESIDIQFNESDFNFIDTIKYLSNNINNLSNYKKFIKYGFNTDKCIYEVFNLILLLINYNDIIYDIDKDIDKDINILTINNTDNTDNTDNITNTQPIKQINNIENNNTNDIICDIKTSINTINKKLCMLENNFIMAHKDTYIIETTQHKNILHVILQNINYNITYMFIIVSTILYLFMSCFYFLNYDTP